MRSVRDILLANRSTAPGRILATMAWYCWVTGILLVGSTVQGFAQTPASVFDSANKLYEQGKFSDAAAVYQRLAEARQVSEPLYFNWGNALFKSGRIGRAIAAYQQAERMAPRDPDVRANLQFARNQVQGPTLLPDRVSRWLGKLTLNEWTCVSAAGFWTWLLLLTAIQLRPTLGPALKSYALWAGMITAVLCGLLAFDFYFDRLVPKTVVIVPEAAVRQAPLEESQSVFTLHDGAEAQVLDQKDQWLQVQVDSHRTGWIKKDAVE